MTDTKFGCGQALCGACIVHRDGVAVRSCQMTMGEIKGRSVTSSLRLCARRKAERPIADPDGFKGILQVDGYAGLRVLAGRSDVELVFC
jgi:hypothetical protein